MNQPIRTILIDDENASHLTMRNLLTRIPDVKHVGEAKDLLECAQLIKDLKPDIVFLDIEMPGQSGLQLFDHINIQDISFHLIFTTAYSEYALNAFEMSAVDYLLKPIQLEKLKLAVSKAAQNIRNQSSQSGEQYSVLRDHLTNHTNKRLAVSLADEIVFLDINEIEYLEADGAYTKIFSKNNQSILASKNLNTFEQLLAGFPNFFRCHRSYLINMQAIS